MNYTSTKLIEKVFISKAEVKLLRTLNVMLRSLDLISKRLFNSLWSGLVATKNPTQAILSEIENFSESSGDSSQNSRKIWG